jgi:hypothetical protein
MKVSKSRELFGGGGAVSVLGDSGCCFLAAVRFFVDDGMVAGNVTVKNSCWRVVESENAGDAIRSGSELGFDLKKARNAMVGTQNADAGG